MSPAKIYGNHRINKIKQNSFSSSEDDLPTSLECTSGDDKELDNSSFHERSNSFKNQRFDTSKRKSKYLGKNKSFDKDSGISEEHHRELSSDRMQRMNYTNYGQSYENKFNPVTWKPAKDGKRLIGHMILRKTNPNNMSGEIYTGILGLKVVTKILSNTDQSRAYISKVKKDSIADIIGHLLPGDEVIEWNGQSFRGLSKEEVNDIISKSKHTETVELIVQRNLDSLNEEINNSDAVYFSGHSNFVENKNQYELPSPVHVDRIECTNIQMRFFYNHLEFEFIVNISSATNLKSTNFHKECSSFVSLILDLERRESRIINDTNCPVWNEEFVFTKVSDKYLKSKDILVTVFDYNKLYNKSTPIAEVIIELCKADFSNRLYSYPLSLYYEEQEGKSTETPTPIHRSYIDNSFHSFTHDLDSEKLYNIQNYSDEESTVMNFQNSPPDIVSRLISSMDYDQHKMNSVQRNMSQPYEDFIFPINEYDSIHQRSFSRQIDSVENYLQQQPEILNYPCRKEEQMQVDRNPTPLIRNDQKRIHQDKHDKSNTSEIVKFELTEKFINDNNKINYEVEEVQQKPKLSEFDFVENEPNNDLNDPDDGLRRLESSEIYENRKRRPSVGHKFSTVLGFSKKGGSTSNLDRKSKTSFQRSEEVLPHHLKISTVREEDLKSYRNGITSPSLDHNNYSQYKLDNYNESAICSTTQKSEINQITSKLKPSNNQKAAILNENHIEIFVEGLGPGQLVGCQVLGIHSMGELQLSFIDRKGKLDIEIIRARNLIPKANSKSLPQLYVKIYLMDGKTVIEKQRTPSSNRRTLDPLFQQQLSFTSDYQNKILQATVWGEYSRMDKKCFMGRCEILLEDLDFSSIVFGWYKLYSVIASKVSHAGGQVH